MSAKLKVSVLTVRGSVNYTHLVIPNYDNRFMNKDECIAESDKRFIDALRKDVETGLNPSVAVSSAEFYHRPFIEKQKAYQELPVEKDNHTVIDAFLCFGTRFGLKHLIVLVEVCRCPKFNYWANIYYVADSIVPAAILRSEEWTMTLDEKHLEDFAKQAENFKAFQETLNVPD